MPFVISFLSQKGGVGKSTLCRLVSAAFADSGWSVGVCDADRSQKTITKWIGRRQDAAPEASEITPLSVTGTAWPRNVSELSCDLVVVDGAPHATTETMAFAACSDLVVIPTGTSVDDLSPSVLLARQLIEAGVSPSRIRFVLTRVATKRGGVEQAIETLNSNCPGVVVLGRVLKERAGYREVMNYGLSPHEHKHWFLRGEATKLAEQIFDALVEVDNGNN